MLCKMSVRIYVQKFVCDSTHPELGRQRELKLRTQLEKQETTIARYKERAIHMSKGQVTQRALEEAQQKRAQAESEAEAHAARCADLAAQLDEMQEQREVEELLQTNLRCIARVAGNLAQQTPPRPRPFAPRSAPIQFVSHAEDDSETAEQLAATQAQRDALLVDLEEAHTQLRHLQAHCDTLEDELENRAALVELDEDRLAYARLTEQHATAEAAWYQSKLQMAEDRCAWLEAQLNHTHAVHSQVLSALHAKERSLQQEAKAHVDATLQAALQNETQLRAHVAHLEEELDRVAWYEEAYAQRSKQADLLAEIASLADEDARAQKIEALSTHIDALHGELSTLNSRHDQLMECNAHWERNLEGLDAQPMKRRRAVSDVGQHVGVAPQWVP